MKCITGLCLAFCLMSAEVCADGWISLEQDGLTLYVQTPDSVRASGLLSDLLTARREVLRKLGGFEPVPMAVYMAPSQAVFDSLTRGRLPHWSAAVAFPDVRTIVLKRLPGQYDELMRVARHELSHVILNAVLGQRVPVWFDEGVAMWASQEWRLGQAASMLYAALSGGLIALSDIDSVLAFPSVLADLAYTQSQLAVSFLMHLGGPNAVPSLIGEMVSGAPFEVALFRVTGETPDGFERRWAEYVRGRFSLTSFLISPDALWLYMVALLVMVYAGVRWRNRARLRQWEGEDDADALPLRLRLQVRRREDEV